MVLRRNIVFKYIILYLLFVAAGVLSVAQILRIQIVDGERARGELQKRALKKMPVLAQRGNILSHDGGILVASMQKYELRYDFTTVRDSKLFNSKLDSIVRGLATILGNYSYEEYKKHWTALRAEATAKRIHRYHPITRTMVDYPTLQRILRLPLLRLPRNKGGLIVLPSMERIYPYEQMALHTLGVINKEKRGVGIEFSYHKEIAGKAGWEWWQRVSPKDFAPVSSEPETEPINGSDIVSTIDADMQMIAEEAVATKLRSSAELEWGCAVFMDVKTGAVRAIANKSKDGAGMIVESENYALRYRKDPGSTFKLLTFLILLEKGLDLSEHVDTGDGSIRIYDKVYYDERQSGGVLTAREVFENSSNVGTIKLAAKMYPRQRNWQDFMERINAVKIRTITEFDINPQADIRPLFPDIEKDQLALSAMSIGVGLEMTPLQTLALYNAVANGGTMLHPYFVSQIRRDGKPVRSVRQGKVINRSICSQRTLEQLRALLEGCVESGTARSARSGIVSVAGKTGTSHIAEGKGGYTNKKLASFAGYFPAQNPRYSGIVAFRTYETQNKTYGGQYAAPVFKTIAEKIYSSASYWRNAPLRSSTNDKHTSHTTTNSIPYTKNGLSTQLVAALRTLDIPYSWTAKAEWVAAAAGDSAVMLQPRAVVDGIVPDVRGMGIKDAVYLLELCGLRVRFTGRGTIATQYPAAGSAYTNGDIVRLETTNN